MAGLSEEQQTTLHENCQALKRYQHHHETYGAKCIRRARGLDDGAKKNAENLGCLNGFRRFGYGVGSMFVGVFSLCGNENASRARKFHDFTNQYKSFSSSDADASQPIKIILTHLQNIMHATTDDELKTVMKDTLAICQSPTSPPRNRSTDSASSLMSV